MGACVHACVCVVCVWVCVCVYVCSACVHVCRDVTCVCVMCVCTDLEFKSLGVANVHSWNSFDVLSQLCGNLITRALETASRSRYIFDKALITACALENDLTNANVRTSVNPAWATPSLSWSLSLLRGNYVCANKTAS